VSGSQQTPARVKAAGVIASERGATDTTGDETMTTKTLKEVFDERIDAYHRRSDDSSDVGYYLIRFDAWWGGDEEPETVDTLVTMWSSDLDENPSEIPEAEWNTLPAGGWFHCDECTCDECEELAAIGEIQGLRDWSAYFDDLEGHIEMLELEADVNPDCEYEDALKERIAYLKTLSDTWIDNDTTASPDAWKTLTTFTNVAALEQYRKWTDDD